MHQTCELFEIKTATPENGVVVNNEVEIVNFVLNSTSSNYGNQLSYPVFVPAGQKKHQKIIILLFSFSEQSYYATSAFYLAQKLKRPIVLFPVSGDTAKLLMPLAKQLEHGINPLFEANTTIDIFAFSLGDDISRVISLAYPDAAETNNVFMHILCNKTDVADPIGLSEFIVDTVNSESSKKKLTEVVNSDF